MTRAVPDVGVMTPDSSLSVVVFPAPLGPKKATNSPACTRRSIDLTASTLRYSRRNNPPIEAFSPSRF